MRDYVKRHFSRLDFFLYPGKRSWYCLHFPLIWRSYETVSAKSAIICYLLSRPCFFSLQSSPLFRIWFHFRFLLSRTVGLIIFASVNVDGFFLFTLLFLHNAWYFDFYLNKQDRLISIFEFGEWKIANNEKIKEVFFRFFSYPCQINRFSDIMSISNGNSLYCYCFMLFTSQFLYI